VVIKLRDENALRAYGIMVDPSDSTRAIAIKDVSANAKSVEPSGKFIAAQQPVLAMTRRFLEEFLVDALGDGDHSLQVYSPGPPTLVMVRDYGVDDFSDRAWEVQVIDPASENNLPLEAVVEHVAWLRRFKTRVDGSTRSPRVVEGEIITLHQGLNLRPLLTTFGRIGNLLLELKKLVPHGQWDNHLRQFSKKNKIALRTLQIYMQCANPQHAAFFKDHVSIRGFLSAVKGCKRVARAEERREAREAVMASAAPDERYRLVHADCREFDWPDQIGHIGADPPWQDMELYRWLARFAATKLKEGGTLLVQCDTE